MKPPIEHVKVSAKGKEILIKIKRRTGLEHWNEICRVALCRSLANTAEPPQIDKAGDSPLDIEWKTFAGQFNIEITALLIFRAMKDGIDISSKDEMAGYFRAHLERGITSLQNVKNLSELFA
ncbi:DNA sulfur modification protein DndE [Desulfatirhabdium butyrativorans]|uniref:DNA sulfur modification protein DndE n=1 Tax=Desulfatirhabdium butyrativorans TaxID=340467 RepID=UPI000489699B|nr:DNA sulfur modification protein DndE [Desulfatirhabdium butyrativorans]